MGIPDWQKPFIKESSIPLPDGGDTHIHPFGSNENDFVITTRNRPCKNRAYLSC